MSLRGLTITAAAPSLKLTTRARLKSALGLTATGDDALMDDVIGRASAAVDTYCRRTFARQTYTEVGPAFGGIEFQAKQAPVVALGTVAFDGNVLTDVSIGDRDQGALYRRAGFHWTAQSWPGLGGGGRLWDIGTPVAGQEEPVWSVGYTAGFILPGFDVTSGAIKALATDDSFNDSSSGFLAIAAWLRAGDVLQASGFTSAPNNARHVVSGTPTSTKIAVTSALTAEGTGTGRTVVVQTLPLDVEQAAIETAKSYYQQRKTDSAVVEKQMGMARLRFSEQGAAGGQIPPRAAGLLRSWVRAA